MLVMIVLGPQLWHTLKTVVVCYKCTKAVLQDVRIVLMLYMAVVT